MVFDINKNSADLTGVLFWFWHLDGRFWRHSGNRLSWMTRYLACRRINGKLAGDNILHTQNGKANAQADG
jgi:hypothetical protein